jgi:hypothetical protein
LRVVREVGIVREPRELPTLVIQAIITMHDYELIPILLWGMIV